MKTLSTIFLAMTCMLVEPSPSLSEGWYFPIKEDGGFVNDLFYFSGKECKLVEFSCTGQTLGIGEYRIRNGKLRLKFEKLALAYSHKLTEEKLHSEESELRVRVLLGNDPEDLEMPEVICFLQGSRNGALTDETGWASLQPPAGWTEAILQVQCIGYSTVQIPVEIKSGIATFYQVRLGLPNQYEQGEKRIHPIVIKGKNQFRLVYSRERKVTFEKISSHRAKELMEYHSIAFP